MISCTITTEVDYAHAKTLTAGELARHHERSTTELRDKNGQAEFVITAKDITALRAATNTITSILATYEKTNEALDEHRI